MLQVNGFLKINSQDVICFDSPTLLLDISAVIVDTAWHIKAIVKITDANGIYGSEEFIIPTTDLTGTTIDDLLYDKPKMQLAVCTWVINRLKLHSPEATTINLITNDNNGN